VLTLQVSKVFKDLPATSQARSLLVLYGDLRQHAVAFRTWQRNVNRYSRFQV